MHLIGSYMGEPPLLVTSDLIGVRGSLALLTRRRLLLWILNLPTWEGAVPAD